MKRALKIYIWAWVVAVVSTFIAVLVAACVPSHHDLAKDPNNIEKVIKVDLPDISCVESTDNLDRGASRWDVYVHHAKFSETLSANSINVMDERCQTDSAHWQKDEDKGCYSYTCSGGIDELYSISCTIYEDHFVLTYEVDESEGILLLCSFVIVYYVLMIWGIARCVIALIRKATRRKITFLHKQTAQ